MGVRALNDAWGSTFNKTEYSGWIVFSSLLLSPEMMVAHFEEGVTFFRRFKLKRRAPSQEGGGP